MELTVRYRDLPEDDFDQMKKSLGKHNVHFFQVARYTTITANGDLEEMLAILKNLAKYRHEGLVLSEK